MRASRILILNPNSSWAVTDAIRQAISELGETGNCTVEQIDEGPPAIEGLQDEVLAAPLVMGRIAAAEGDYDAFVVACHGDPGVLASREVCPKKPVVGIGEASVLAACALGARFGLITLGGGLVEKKWRQLKEYGIAERCAAVEPTGTGVLHGVEQGVDFEVYVEAGRRAVVRGADVLVLGCAGMIRAARTVEERLGVPVVEPVSAAVAMLRGGR